MFGVKTITITIKENLDLEGLYNKIKDVPFEAGAPEYVKHGLGYVIAFPQEDRENQVWILKTKKGFTVQRSTIIAGLGNTVKNQLKSDALNKFSGGITGMVSQFGDPKKACMAHCDDVAAKINALGL